MSEYIVAIDVGGTFTDLIGYEVASGAVVSAKTPSTPPDFIDGMINGLVALGYKPDQIALIKIGTTIATNTIIMRTGAKTALVTTNGFKDVLHAARASRPTLYDSDWDPAPALVERKDTLTVAERTAYDGEVLEKLSETSLTPLLQVIKDRNIESVAISFLHSYINGQNEVTAKEFFARELPGHYVCISSDVLPEVREFERTSTTVANAYLGPILDRYLSQLSERLEKFGYHGAVLITHSGGGLMSSEAARELPARVCQSGPAAGVIAGANIGRAAGRLNIINLDIGGTSADVSLSYEGRALVRSEWNMDFNITINFPAVDVNTIGAGGGSIARVDAGGSLRVGPDSAGAKPGPACYGRGGVEPTVTDANLLLGRLDSTTKLAGKVALDRDLAAKAMQRVAKPLGMSEAEAAIGILRIMRNNMANGTRLLSIKRGYDPRQFSLVAFGGAGPLHAVELAREIGIPEVIIPYYPGCGSALGNLFVEVRHDFVRSLFETSAKYNLDKINHTFEALDSDARERLRAEGVPEDKMVLRRSIDIRNYGQISGGVVLPVPAGRLDDSTVEALFAGFSEHQQKEFGYSFPRSMTNLEMVNARVSAEADRGVVVDPVYPAAPKAAPVPIGHRDVYFEDGGWLKSAVYDRTSLPIGFTAHGPVVIEQSDTTTLILPGASATVDEHLNLICKVVDDAA
ncbi:MAG: hydantoinase/oxoprolinase family protein [Pseudorhodoplanes sp.]